MRVVALVVLLALAACEAEQPPAEPTAKPEPGDLAEIRARGIIRLAGRSWSDFDTLPSQGLSSAHYRQYAEDFAASQDLAVEWLLIANVGEMLDAVANGTVDIAIANLTVTPARAEQVAFSLPLTRSREWVIGTTLDGAFGVADHTSYVASLAEHYPNAERRAVPNNADPETFLDLIESGAIDATIMDEAAARVVVRSSPKINKLRELPALKDHAWALRRDAKALKDALDAYLLERHVLLERPLQQRDWQQILEAGRLRLLTLNTPTTYYLWRGTQLGFDYELVQLFAEQHDLALEVHVAPQHEELFAWLEEGRGDLIAAGLTPTPQRIERGLRFTQPYVTIRETFVSGGRAIADLAQLAGQRVVVNPDTSYAATLANLQSQADFELAFDARQTQAILESVAVGDIDATLADSHRAQLAATFYPNLNLGLAFEARGLAWAVRENQTELHGRLDEFVEQGYRGYEFNVRYNKYFVNQRRMAQQREGRITGESLSPFDHILRPLAEEAGIDWRLVVSQMYQESGFEPQRVSFAGAEGLLQVLPRTAQEVGEDPNRLAEPEVGIRAGVRYLAWTRDRFSDLPVGEQLLFALGAYNAGAGHVRDGRRLARRLGLDDSLWFDNVEQAMLKLSEPRYAREATHGYVRGAEVVRYVREIHDRYRAYRDHFRMLNASQQDGTG